MSPTLLILKNYTTFKDVQMILKHFFDISTGFRYKKMEKSSPSIYRDVHDLMYQEQLSITLNKLPYSGVRHFCFCCCIAMPVTSLINLQRHLQSKSINLIQENLGCVQKLEQNQRPQIEFSTWTKSILVQSLYFILLFSSQKLLKR